MHVYKSKRGKGVCISEGALSLKNVQFNFNFILHVISSVYRPKAITGETYNVSFPL